MSENAKSSLDCEKDEVKKLIESSVIFENIPDSISIIFPVNFLRENFSEEQIDDFFEGLIPLIDQYIHEKLKQ